MRFISVLFSYALIALPVSVASSDDLSLKVTTPNPSVKSGSRIMITVTTINTSTLTLTYHDTRRACDYSIKVLTSTGEPAPETSFKKALKCNQDGLIITGRDIVRTLKPGESSEEQIEISELYNMSSPGIYSVQVERTFPQIGHFASNTVNISITP